MRGWGRRVPPPPHAAGEMGQALKAVSRLGEPDGGGGSKPSTPAKSLLLLGSPVPCIRQGCSLHNTGKCLSEAETKVLSKPSEKGV